ncbi:MAG: hypothetical protein AAF533_30455 [Acidobacteriota bacterium]
MEAWLSIQGSALGGFGAVAALLLVASGLGRGLTRRLGLRASRHPLRAFLVELVLGLDLLAVLVLVVGSIGLPPGWFIGLLLAVGAGMRAWLDRADFVTSAAVLRRLRHPAGWLLVLALVVPVLPIAGTPPHGWDDLTYHVEVPTRWLAEGRLIVLADNPYSAFPALSELLSTVVLAAGGNRAPGALTVACWLASAALLHQLLRRRLPPWSAMALTLALSWSHLAFMLASESYAEALLGLHVLALVVLVDEGRPGARGAVPLGLLLGGAIGVKLTALTWPALVVLLAWRRRPWVTPSRLVLSVGLAVVLALLFTSRAWLATGNPTWPFHAAVFTPDDPVALAVSEHHHAIATERYGVDAWHAPLTALPRLAREGHLFSGNLGRQWWLVLGLLLLGLAVPRGRRLTLGFALLVLAWALTSQQVRFLWPGVLLAGLAAGQGLRLLGRRWGLAVAVLLLVVTVAEVPASRWRATWSHAQAWLGVGAAPREIDFLYTGTAAGYIPACQAIERRTPEDAVVMLIGETRGLYVPREHVLGSPLLQGRFFTEAEGQAAPELAWRELREAGVTHLLLGDPPRHPDRHDRQVQREQELRERLHQLAMAGRLRLVWSGASGYGLFEVTP